MQASGLPLVTFTRPLTRVVQLSPTGQYWPLTEPSRPLLPILTVTFGVAELPFGFGERDVRIAGRVNHHGAVQGEAAVGEGGHVACQRAQGDRHSAHRVEHEHRETVWCDATISGLAPGDGSWTSTGSDVSRRARASEDAFRPSPPASSSSFFFAVYVCAHT